jgi:hypothetical protein
MVREQLVAHLDDGDPYKVHKPCPFVSCRFHLHADVGTDGVVTVLSTEQTPLDIAHTCVLDVIDEHPDGVTREEIAVIERVSEERTRFRDRRIEKRLREAGLLEAWEGHEGDKGETLLGGAMEA